MIFQVSWKNYKYLWDFGSFPTIFQYPMVRICYFSTLYLHIHENNFDFALRLPYDKITRQQMCVFVSHFVFLCRLDNINNVQKKWLDCNLILLCDRKDKKNVFFRQPKTAVKFSIHTLKGRLFIFFSPSTEKWIKKQHQPQLQMSLTQPVHKAVLNDRTGS